jgi:hypothetical protein
MVIEGRVEGREKENILPSDSFVIVAQAGEDRNC